MTVLAVAAISARMLAEAAARDGFDVVALDLFGDADTRRASVQWLPIGEPAALQFDGERVLAALHELARPGRDVIGWVAGSGFEGRPDLLAEGAKMLPLIGTAPEAVRRVRDPAAFFGALDAHGIAHPPVETTAAPADARGWLLKDAQACGGWHIRRARECAAEAPSHSHYFQREMPGTPMSATFIANGREAMLLGFNELVVRPSGAHPFVFHGAIGPVPLAAGVAQRIGHAVRSLSAEFSLRGWCSLDFMLDGEAIGVLEVNPRPPASLALYARRGLMDAQLRACLDKELPSRALSSPSHVAGFEIVYARRTLHLSEPSAQRLSKQARIHDLPAAGARFAAGDPVCSLSLEGRSAAQVRTQLSAGRDALLNTLETLS